MGSLDLRIFGHKFHRGNHCTALPVITTRRLFNSNNRAMILTYLDGSSSFISFMCVGIILVASGASL